MPPRIPLPGLRTFIPRVSFVSRPLLPLTSRLASPSLQSSGFISTRSSWHHRFRMFSYSPLRSSSPSSPGHESGSAPGTGASLSQRLKHLIKTYGWYALGVYVVLSTIDFAVAFAVINVLGAEQVSRFTHVIKDRLSSFVHSRPLEPGAQELEIEPAGGREGLYAMLVLAYTVHKTLFLPVRVGLTAAFTPRFVGWLTRRGWTGGEGARRAGRELRERVRGGRDRD
ncbi:hypothetical protein EW145_g5911 [Phellinidium pouzarii]|uniref:DUF1279 domain-containing protein n=1 Tax=Phellinidium pouzarii TaxID=167371 RepID=A0A4V3XC06_9AGAM|nr:hypothetical protein EW145_g5911 [Phellinidium pouzarii]